VAKVTLLFWFPSQKKRGRRSGEVMHYPSQFDLPFHPRAQSSYPAAEGNSSSLCNSITLSTFIVKQKGTRKRQCLYVQIESTIRFHHLGVPTA